VSWKVKVEHAEFDNSYEVWLYFKKTKHKMSDTFPYQCKKTQTEAWKNALEMGTQLERSIVNAFIEDDM